MTFKNKKLSLSLVLSLTAFSIVGCSGSNTDTVASLKGAQISSTELEKEINLTRALTQLTNGEALSEKELTDYAKETADYLATTEFLYEEGKKNKMDATEDDIKAELEQIGQFLTQNDTLSQALKASGFTEQDVKDGISKSLTADNFTANLYKNISISEADVEEFFNENKDTLYTKEFVDASHILIKTIDSENKPLSEDKKAEAKKKATDILNKVEAGEDFAKLAKEHSEDGTAPDGGALGKFGRQQMVAPFEEAAFALEPGKTSKLVESPFGYHIIKVHDKGNEVADYNTIAGQVRNNLIEELVANEIVKLKDKYNVKMNEESIASVVKGLKPLKFDVKTKNEETKDTKEDTKEDTNNINDKEAKKELKK